MPSTTPDIDAALQPVEEALQLMRLAGIPDNIAKTALVKIAETAFRAGVQVNESVIDDFTRAIQTAVARSLSDPVITPPLVGLLEQAVGAECVRKAKEWEMQLGHEKHVAAITELGKAFWAAVGTVLHEELAKNK